MNPFIFNLSVSASEIPTLESGSLFQFGADHITALVANASSLITSFWPVILLIAGMSLAIIIVLNIIWVFDNRKDRELSERADRAMSETRKLLKKI